MQVESRSSNPVKRCEYCGAENAIDASSCRGCGTPFALPPPVPNTEGFDASQIPPLLPEGPGLTARTATVIFLAFLMAQVVGAFLVSVLAYAAHPSVFRDPEAMSDLQQKIMTPAIVVGMLASSAVLPLIARFMLRERLRDTSPEGAAWVLGSRKQMLQAFGVGAFVGCCWIAAFLLLRLQSPQQPGPLTKMAMNQGWSRALFSFIALVQAPIFEELMFRGVMYGGLRRSFGAVTATAVTTLLFCLLHLPETIHLKVALIAIAIMGLVTLWFRLRSAAIGPAIAAHFGYNAILALTVYIG